jgi:hypothetical protein
MLPSSFLTHVLSFFFSFGLIVVFPKALLLVFPAVQVVLVLRPLPVHIRTLSRIDVLLSCIFHSSEFVTRGKKIVPSPLKK